MIHVHLEHVQWVRSEFWLFSDEGKCSIYRSPRSVYWCITSPFLHCVNDIVWSVNLVGCTRAAQSAGRGVKRWHRIPWAVFNLTWNLNQESRSLMIPAKVAAVLMPQRWPGGGGASLDGQSWGHPLLLWPGLHSQRISLLGNIRGHDLMSANLQRVCGFAVWCS